MKRYSVLMTEPAADDLHQITDYIAKELREPVAARKLIDMLKEAVMSLTEIPTRYATAADEHLAAQGMRKLLVKNYIVFYMVSEKEGTVTVIRILYGRRNWERLL